MTTLDTCIDPQAAALATLVKGAVNYEIQNDPRFQVTDDAIEAVYGHPRPLPLLSKLKLPALTIFRDSEQKEQFSAGHVFDVVTFRFDYVADNTSYGKLITRWPLLRAVWRELIDAIFAGSHAEVLDNYPLLTSAGFVWVEIGTAKVQYGYAPQGKNAYPYFRGSLQMKHSDVKPELTESVPFLSIAANYILDGLEDEEQPHGESLTHTPTGEEALDAADNPLDDDFEGEDI